MALSDSEFKFEVLPSSYNTPTHNKSYLPKIIESLNSDVPKVLHFHNSIDEIGLLNKVNQNQIDTAVTIANEVIQKRFNNKLFWDYRYAYYPKLGSGIGSRGKYLNTKQKMLKLAGIEKAESILDVGCGDGEVLSPFKLNKYTGIDISEEAIKLNQAKRPDDLFLLFPDKEAAPDSDLVICLDVLLHQDTPKEYLDIIDYITRKTKKCLLVSGYGSEKASDNSSMCHYYENLRSSLERTGRFKRVYKFFEYRNLDVIIAEKEDYLVSTPANLNDIDESILQKVAKKHDFQDILFESVTASRAVFGWFTKHYPRLFEYPWILSQLGRDLSNSVIADFGAGISPVPLLLSMRGATLYTLDYGRKVTYEDVAVKNEWGYFDYNILDGDITSIHGKLTPGAIGPASLDVWYSISVIEHLEMAERLEILRMMRMSLKEKGRLLLSVDIYKNSQNLWNYSAGKQVETIEKHGTLKSLCDELENLGFSQINSKTIRMPDSERVDIAYISAMVTGAPTASIKAASNNDSEINIDIGGQNNRNDQKGRWKIVDLHDGAEKTDATPMSRHGSGRLTNVAFWRDKIQFYKNLFIIKKSKLLDVQWYLLQNQDVKNSGVDPLKHYLNFGWREGRDPSPFFSTDKYLKKHPELRRQGICPLVHYVKSSSKSFRK